MLQKAYFLVAAVFAALTLFAAVPAFAEPTTYLSLPGLGTIALNVVGVTSFDASNDWENYTGSTGTQLDVEKGVYRASTISPGYAWGLNAQEHGDVVLEAEVTPMTIFTDTGAGVMCRADTSDNGDGYYFMINGSGYYSIRIGDGDDIRPLVDWTPSKAIHTGIDRNVIRAVCLQDHLAMYVNDQLVGSVDDDTYAQGYAGLAVAGGNDGVDMIFDNVTFYQAQWMPAVLASR